MLVVNFPSLILKYLSINNFHKLLLLVIVLILILLDKLSNHKIRISKYLSRRSSNDRLD